MSKFTLGQRQFPTLGLRSQQPKNYVGPTLSCYLGYGFFVDFAKAFDSVSRNSLLYKLTKTKIGGNFYK